MSQAAPSPEAGPKMTVEIIHFLAIVVIGLGAFGYMALDARKTMQIREDMRLERRALDNAQVSACRESGGTVRYTGFPGPVGHEWPADHMSPVRNADGSVSCFKN